jgi:DNA-binding beta-propeller fold protein YncE
VKSVTFVSAAARAAGSATERAAAADGAAGEPAGGNPDMSAGWRPRTWLGAPAPGGLALPPARPTAAWLYAPRGVYLGPVAGKGSARRKGRAAPARGGGRQEVLVIADTGNHRVLIWHDVPAKDEQPCDVVLGQPNAFTEGPAAGTGDTRTGLHLPTGVLVHDGKLVVADAWHHRVLIYGRLPTTPGAVPDLVLGQPDLDSVAPNAGGDCRPSTMYWPFGVAVAGGRFYVADTGNRRVLGWTGGLPSSARTPPDVILGQPDGNSREENRGGPPGPGSFRWPHGIAAIADALYVADAGNHRVLGWAAHPERDMPACLVLGQPDFAAASELPYGPQGPGALRFPYAADADGTALAVADTANNRVLLWDSATVAGATAAAGAVPAGTHRGDEGRGPDATAVLGQPGFGPSGENRWSGVTRDSLCWPYGLSLAGDRLAVADSGNNRVVIWQRE